MRRLWFSGLLGREGLDMGRAPKLHPDWVQMAAYASENGF